MTKKSIKPKSKAKKKYMIWVEAIEYENGKDGFGTEKPQKVNYDDQEYY